MPKTSTFMGLALAANADGNFVIGETADILYGGDMTNDTEGMGIPVISADGDQHFALSVYADDAGDELAAGWVSSIFGSMKIYEAVTPSANLSAFGVTGQLHLAASVSTIGNLCGLYGIAETVSGTTTGIVVPIFIQNPTSTAQFDAAFAFGQDSQFAGCVTVAAVGGSNTHKLKVYAGGTLYYIPMYTA